MKLYLSYLTVILVMANVLMSVYDHNLLLAGAWGSSLLGWLIVLLKELEE